MSIVIKNRISMRVLHTRAVQPRTHVDEHGGGVAGSAYSIRSFCYDARAGVNAIEVGKGTKLIDDEMNLFNKIHIGETCPVAL